MRVCGPPRRAASLSGVRRLPEARPAQSVPRRARAPRGHRPPGVARTRSRPRGKAVYPTYIQAVCPGRGASRLSSPHSYSHSGQRVRNCGPSPTHHRVLGGRGGWKGFIRLPLPAQRFRAPRSAQRHSQGRLCGPCVFAVTRAAPRARRYFTASVNLALY